MPKIPLSDIPRFYSHTLGVDEIAVVHGYDNLSWGALDRASTEMAWSLKARGVGQDDFVTLALPNGCAFFIATFAIWKVGATPHVVSWKLPQAEFDEILELLRPKLVITGDPSQSTAHPSVTPTELQSSHHQDLPPLMAKSWKAMSSGGSTGRPKIIVDHLPTEFDPDLAVLKLPKQGVVLNPGPLYHNAPFVAAHYALCRGNRVVCMERFDPESTLRLIDAHKVNWISMVPTMMGRIWRLPPDLRDSFDLSSLETVWHMAAPMPVWLKKAWIDWLGAGKIWELYAGTERTGRTTISGADWLNHPGSVGRPDPDCFVEIRDEAGATLPSGAVGEIYFGRRDPAQPYHYIGAESRVLAGDLESLGDYGWLDDDGFLYLADRRTDLIISGGANIYPAEVESALMEHPGVDVAVVIGLPNDDLGAQVHAIVRRRDDFLEADGEEELAAFVRQKLALYKTPRSYEFTNEDLRDDAGKVRRSKLREDRLADAGKIP